MARKKNLRHPILTRVLEKGESIKDLEKGEMVVTWEDNLPQLYIGTENEEEENNIFESFKVSYTSYLETISVLLRKISEGNIEPLTNHTDINSVVTPGIYELILENEYENCPINTTLGYNEYNYQEENGGLLFVLSTKLHSSLLQIIIPFKGTNLFNCYIRTKSGSPYDGAYHNTWNEWEIIASTDSISRYIKYYDSSVKRDANTVLAAPNGKKGVAEFRSLVADDIPDLSDIYLKVNATSKDVKFKSVNAAVYYKSGVNLDNIYAAKTHTHSDYLDNTNITNSKGNFTVDTLRLKDPNKIGNAAFGGNDLGFTPIYGSLETPDDRVKGQLDISSYGGLRNSDSKTYNLYMSMLPCSAEVFFCSGSASGRKYDISIGAQDKALKNIYAQNYLPQSDKNKKEDIETISDKFISIFDKVNFVSYKFKNDNENDIDDKKHSRHHMGVLSQDFENLLKEHNISNYDCSFIASSFFLNSSEAYKSTYAGINIKKFNKNNIDYHYSENTYNWKHRNDDKKTGDYEVFNEITSIYPGFLNYEDYRKNLGYIMIEDISKLNHDQPPIVVNSIFITMKDGTETTVNLNNEVLNYYYYPDTAETECVYDENSDTLTINFKDIGEIRQNKAIFLKLNEVLNIDNIERIDFDLDLISECKIRLLPDGNYKNANVWDRFNNDQILYNYSFNYNELFVLASNVLQETRKEFKAYKEEKEKEITELKENYNSLLKRIEALEGK